MPDEFPYDVFLSHSSKDKAAVRTVAEQLRKDGLNVTFDAWVLKVGDSIPVKIEEGLDQSRMHACLAVASRRTRMLCMSANAFGSDWAQLADPLSKPPLCSFFIRAI
jgi:predicted ATP-dependent serine protease